MRGELEDIPIGIAKELWPVLDGHDCMSCVHEVKVVLRMKPGTLDIVNHELYVWRHPGWLDGGEIDAKHCGGRILISH